MDAALISPYVERLGLKPVQLGPLMAEPDVDRPWRVATVERGACTLLGIASDGELAEHAARSGTDPIAVGDFVLLDANGRVSRVLPRTTWLSRGSAHHEGEAQLIAANLDTVFVVAAFAETAKLERRSLRARRLDRFISAVKEGGATPVVVLNKVDLSVRTVDELAELRRELDRRLAGVEVVCVSALEGRGLAALEPWLAAGETVAFIGPSGVGKSSLINALSGEARQVVRSVRGKDTKGRHTTTRRELITLETGALLIDTPGVRQFAVLASDGVAGFEDIDELAEGCRFADCAHDSEPGCAVRDAVERGELPGDRLESWRAIGRDVRRSSTKHDGYARSVAHAEERRFGRLVRDAQSIKKPR